ncbi:MAG: CsiV family protein [Steroidobacteraceae bacterium]
MIRSKRRFALVALLALGPAAAQQATPGLQAYDVELVIFRTLNSNATAEEWNMEGAAAGQRLAIPDEEPSPFATPAEPAPATATFPALPASKFKLTAVTDSLRRSRNYQPLAHFGWTQPGFPRDAAKAMSINSMVPGSSGVVGQVALWRGRYLHLTLDLVYEPRSAEETGQRFVLRQTRRMRSNENHYLDHPRFGVIAVIRPRSD